jgi:lysophospholipase L1-like esterase
MTLRLTLVLTLALLAASLAVNWVGLRKAYEGYDHYNDVRLDPTGELARRLHEQVRGEHAVVLLGDSNAELWAYPDADLLNLGISGQTAVQVALRSDAYRESLRGGLLIITGGGNDANSVGTNPGRKDEIVAAALDALERTATNHAGRFGQIAIITPPPMFRAPLRYRLSHLTEMLAAREDIGDGIRRLAAEHALILIDADRILRERMGTETLSDDGMHMNRRAYGHLEAGLRRALGATGAE